jgi:hypothetical protein
MEPVSFVDSAACINILSLFLEGPHKPRKEKREKKNKGARFEIEYLASFRVCGDTFQHSTSHRNLLGTGEEKNVQRKRRNTLMLPMYYIYTHTYTVWKTEKKENRGLLPCLLAFGCVETMKNSALPPITFSPFFFCNIQPSSFSFALLYSPLPIM